MFCTECEQRCSYDDLNEDDICDDCVNTSCDYCGDAKGVVKMGKDLLCPVCYREALED